MTTTITTTSVNTVVPDTVVVTDPCEDAEKWYRTEGVEDEDVVAAYQAKGAGSYANSLHNLVEDVYDLADTGHAPDWDDTNGWKFDGSTDYLDTGNIPTSEQTSVIVRYSNYVDGEFSDYYLISKPTLGKQTRILFSDAEGNSTSFYVDSNIGGIGSTYASGVFAIAYKYFYYDGNLIDTLTAAPTPFTDNTTPIYIASANGLTAFWQGYVQAIAIYNKELNSTQIAAITDNMEAL